MHGNDLHSDADVVTGVVRELHGLLPDQGPIGVFVHHNTLHALQHKPFEVAVVEAAAIYGARAWPEMAKLRADWQRGRIEDEDVDAVLAVDDVALPLGLTRRRLRWTLLKDDIDVDDEFGCACAGRDDAVFARARAVVGARFVDGAFVEDSDDDVDAELIRLGLAFLDRGQAGTSLPHRDEGFLRCACRALAQTAPRACKGVGVDAARVVADNVDARAVVDAVCADLGVDGDAQRRFLIEQAMRLRGIAGMFSRFERFPHEGPAPSTLLDYLAVRLLLLRRAKNKTQKTTTKQETTNSTAWLLRGLAHAAGHTLQGVSRADVEVLLGEVAAFSRNERNRLLFLAWERAYRRRVLSGLIALRAQRPTAPNTQRAALQVVCCIDEREESFRRALEEDDDVDIVTFGAAGFFGVAVDYKGVDDHEAVAHCPVVVVPAHEVHEAPLFTARRWHALRARARAAWHAVERGVGRASRSLFGGFGVAVFFGPFAGALATGRVVAPRASLTAWHRLKRSVAPAPATRLGSLRSVASPVGEAKKPYGFSIDEAADRVCATLQNIGLTVDQARVVVLLGHGSTSLNNPHESAHDCGACGGRRGGANARLFAALANRVDVRAAVKARGVVIADDVWFVGGLHDTASDAVELYDLEDVPRSHVDDVEVAVRALERGRKGSARERCRRFDVPLGISPDDALAHVETRSSHLGQPRPEYGHCTNAIAVVGRRALTRGLHLDRRPFLVSYDPAIDDDGRIVERVLAAVGPVGAGINLEYYFSAIDNEVYGCGTKLPHNVTGLLGVINGHASDLRTGLPLQMVELHEAMRLLLIVEATPERLLAVAGKQAEVKELVVNGWVQLVSCDPDTGRLQVFDNGQFVEFGNEKVEVPVVETSHDWHGASREFVGPAIVKRGLR